MSFIESGAKINLLHKEIMRLLILLSLLHIPICHSKLTAVYKTIENNSTIGSGLKLIAESVNPSNFTNGISICGRFNLTRLAGTTRILAIGNQMWAHMGYDETFFEFGFRNGIVKEVHTNNFRLWSTNRWHQICISFNRKTSHLMFVKDGKVTNINYKSNDLNLDYLNEVVTSEFYAGRSWWDPEKVPYKEISSVNIWDRGLTLKESEDWTSCR